MSSKIEALLQFAEQRGEKFVAERDRALGTANNFVREVQQSLGATPIPVLELKPAESGGWEFSLVIKVNLIECEFPCVYRQKGANGFIYVAGRDDGIDPYKRAELIENTIREALRKIVDAGEYPPSATRRIVLGHLIDPHNV